MNAKNNHSISKRAILLGLVFCVQQLPAQEIYEWEAWRQGRNIAGLDASSSPRAAIGGKTAVSNAELYGGFTSGGFHSASEAGNLWSAGASATTEVHIPGLILTGDFSFKQSSGKDMMGSMFVHPGYYPIDVLEFTPGQKTLQAYGMGGGLAWLIDSRWTPGATVRFEGTNYAKRKDLRHTTYRQELEVVPSLSYDGGDFVLGVSGIFSKTSEFIQAEQIGSATADSYYAFLDKGIMYGSYQVWDGSGIHLDEAGVNRLPVKELSYGFAVQAEIGDFLYGDVEYCISRGEAGEKGYTWFRFPGASMSGKVQYTSHGSRGVHVFRAGAEWKRKDNDETVLEKISSGGVTTPTEYGSNRIFSQRTLSGGPSYGFYGKDGLIVTTSALVTKVKDRSTLMYPFLDNDEATTMDCELQAVIPAGHFELTLGVSAGCKIGEHRHVVENDDENLGVTTTPFRLQEWWDREQEITDATRIGGVLGVRYNFSVAKTHHLYISAECSFVHAFGIVLLPGAGRQISLIRFGYDF